MPLMGPVAVAGQAEETVPLPALVVLSPVPVVAAASTVAVAAVAATAQAEHPATAATGRMGLL